MKLKVTWFYEPLDFCFGKYYVSKFVTRTNNKLSICKYFQK